MISVHLKLLTTPEMGHCLVQVIQLSFLIEKEILREVTAILVQLVSFEDCVQLFAVLLNDKKILLL